MITPKQRAAVHRVLERFDAAGLRYQVTGGFAGILYGSKWPLHDLDLDVAKADMRFVAPVLGGGITRHAGPYRDGEFDLVLLQAEVGTLGVDVSQVEGAKILTAKGWEPMRIDLARREMVPWDGRHVPTIPLADLLAYKRRLPGRAADVEELSTL